MEDVQRWPCCVFCLLENSWVRVMLSLGVLFWPGKPSFWGSPYFDAPFFHKGWLKNPASIPANGSQNGRKPTGLPFGVNTRLEYDHLGNPKEQHVKSYLQGSRGKTSANCDSQSALKMVPFFWVVQEPLCMLDCWGTGGANMGSVLHLCRDWFLRRPKGEPLIFAPLNEYS